MYPFPRKVLWRTWERFDIITPGRQGGFADPRGIAAWGVIGGGIFGGTASAVLRWAAAYFTLLDALSRHSAGAAPALLTDQDVFRRLYLLSPQLWALVPSPTAQVLIDYHRIPLHSIYPSRAISAIATAGFGTNGKMSHRTI